MDLYYVITWWQDGDWHQTPPIVHGSHMMRQYHKHLDDPEHTGVQVWQMRLVIGREAADRFEEYSNRKENDE